MSCSYNECYADEFDCRRGGYEEDDDYNYGDDYEHYEEWKSSYIEKGLKKWGRGVCWDWCEQGFCSDDFMCGRAHPILKIESSPGGNGCCIEIDSSSPLLNNKSKACRLPNIEGMIKGLGFVEQTELVFESDAKLNVRYEEKELAKELGACWNPDERTWYVPAGRDVRPFEKWSPKVDGKYVTGLAYDAPAYLNNTFSEKDKVKALGAYWSPAKRKWFVLPGTDLRPFLKWKPKVNDRLVVETQTFPTFVNKELDLTSTCIRLRRSGFNDVLFEFTTKKRAGDYRNGRENVSDGNVGPVAGIKRARCTSPERDDRKLPAAVTPQKTPQK